MRPNNIPKWADYFLKWYCRPVLLEEIQGDLYELFGQIEQEQGTTQAKRNFIWNVLRTFRLSTIKKVNIQVNMTPFKSHFKIAYRQLWKQKYHSLINIMGLVLGFACCLLIGLYVRQELSYDTKHPQKDQLYRLLTNEGQDGVDDHWVYHNPPTADLLVNQFPEVEKAFRVNTTGSRLVKSSAGAQNTFEEYLIYADQSMLDMLFFPFKFGDKKTALTQPNTLILTEEKAKQYFGAADPVGQQLYFDNNMEQPFTVTGVIKKTTAKSHLEYDFYLSMESVPESKSGSWRISDYITYLRLSEGTNTDVLEGKIFDLLSQHLNWLIQDDASYKLQAVEDIYLKSQTVTIFGHWPTGNPRSLWLFSSIAIIILLVAIINFVNLSTARSANRSAEVGIRKIMGSNRGQLISQFLVESILQSLIALILCLALVRSVLPFFEQLSGQSLSMPKNIFAFLLLCLGGSILIGLLAGLYPAFFIANFSPLKAIKGYLNRVSKSKLQWGLVSGQFIASFVLIFSTILIYRQMQYIQNKDLGFDREQVIILEDTYSLGEELATFKGQLQQLSDVESVTLSSYVPVDGYRLNGSTIEYTDPVAGLKEFEFRRWYIDEDYLSTLGIDLKQGRNFSTEFSLDSNAIILNEAAAKMLGQEEVLDQRIVMNRESYKVVGVVEDFHSRSMREDILPLAFYKTDLSNITSTIIRAKSDNYESLLGQIEEVWAEFAPNQILRYNFLDERFNQMYATERRVGITFATFTMLAILIASMGLLALTSFIAENRKKELSIRKVLGASVGNLYRLQTQRFGRILIIAFVLGAPLAYYIMQQWLNDFAYRIAISWDIFLLAMLFTLLLIAATISYQAIRIARANPVDALRSE